MKRVSGSAPFGAVTRIGAYTVERLLGSGGSGEVYSVRDPARAASVALKLLPRRSMETRPDLVPAFRREYHRLQLLRHPRIVEVHDYGSSESGLYYTMELVDGPELKAIVPLPWRQACALLRDVGLSLAIVHSRRLLHRDVGPGNVRCTREGRAKLIDFGAMVSMGIPSSVVGTPPCIPPEAIDHEPLDARSDLYGLGALGYFLLTGEHAYPASSLSQLVAAWRELPAPPSARANDVPEALDRLLLSLLQLDRRLRPGSAIEVINHLEAIAELPALAASEAAQSSLVAPALVGRAAELDLLGRSLAAARKHQGSSVLIEADTGLGRTRLLDQFIVDANQRDVLVASVHPGRAGARTICGYDGCLALCEAILRQLPLRSGGQLDRHNAVLSELFAGMQQRPSEASSQPPEPAARQKLVTALHGALLALCEQFTLVVLVDDLQLCDAASASLFARLAASAYDQRLLLVATRERGAKVIAADAVQAILQSARRVLLRPLQIQAIETLVRSAFVGAPHVKAVAEWATALSEGNPAKIVELLKYLVERGFVTFSEGAWSLPEQLDGYLLPGGVVEALRARIDSLSASAREVAEFVCISAYPVNLANLNALQLFPAAAPHADELLLDALDELTSAGVITSDEGKYLVAHHALSEALLDSMSPERVSSTHLHLGRALCNGLPTLNYDPGIDLWSAFTWGHAGYHLLRGGERKLGAELWMNAVRYSLEVDFVVTGDGLSWYREAHLLTLGTADEFGMTAFLRSVLRTALVQTAVHGGDPELVSHGERAIEELEIAVGARDYEACAQIADPKARVKTALGMATARWQQTPEAQRGMTPSEALPLFVACNFATASIYWYAFETDKLVKLPDKLTPYVSLGPVIVVFRDLIEAIVASATGRTEHELRLRLKTRDALASVTGSRGTSATSLQHVRAYALYFAASIGAVRNPERALQTVEQLDGEAAFMQYGAWQVRLLANIYAANASEAQACAERLEMAAVQEGTGKSQLLAFGLLYLAEAYALTGDVLGLRTTIEKLRPLAEQFPGWRPLHDAARAHYQRLRGQLHDARLLAESATEKALAGKHRGYGFAQLTRLSVLLESGEPLAALELQRDALACARRYELGPELELQLLKCGALAHVALGDAASARLQLDAALSAALAGEFAGAQLGELHLCGARVALLEMDGTRFEQHAALLARHTCAHSHPVMMARYKRLLADAEQAGLAFSPLRASAATIARNAPAQAATEGDADAWLATPQRALERVLASSGAEEGFLFSVREKELRLIAAAGSDATALGLHDAVMACVAAQPAAASQGAVMDTLTATLTSVIRTESGRLFQTAMLNFIDEDGSVQTSGALALRAQDELATMPRWDELLALASVVRGQPKNA